MRSKSARLRVSLAAACVALTFVYVITATLFQNKFLNDPDTFLHISVGKWMLQHGRFMVADQFSYTALGKTWFATDWISEIVFAALYRIGQWQGVTEIVAVTSALISGVLCFYLAIKLRLSVAFGLTIFIAVLISPHFLARPVIFSYLLLSIWIVLILEIEEQNKWATWRAFILVPVMVLWVNVHGSFTFGLLILYLFLGNAIWAAYNKKETRTLRRLVLLLLGVTLAAVITPYGVFSALKTVQLMSDPALANIDEWRAPDFNTDPFHLASIVGLFALLVYLGIRLRGPRLLTLLLVTILALEHKRGLGIFALVAPLVLVRPFSEYVPWVAIQDHTLDPVLRFANKNTGVIALACTLILAIAGLSMWTIGPRIQPPPGRAPEEAVAVATSAGFKGNVLNSYGFGAYLIFNGIPTFVDGRVELYGNQFLKRYFDAMNLVNVEEASTLLKQYDVHWALLQPREPIIFMLKANGWVQLYGDNSAVVLIRKP